MIRKLILLGATLALITPSIAVQAAENGISNSTKHKVSSRKIMRTIRADRKYQVQKVNYNTSVFQEDSDRGGVLQLASSKALIVNQETGETLYAKNTDLPTPIAS